MPPIDRSVDSISVAADPTEVHLALLTDGYPAPNDRKCFKVDFAINNDSDLNISPLAALKRDCPDVNGKVTKIVERNDKDKQKLAVTRNKCGELLGIVFVGTDTSLQKENGSWVIKPPSHPDTTIHEVKVDKKGTIELSVTFRGEKGTWIHHSDGRQDWPFKR